MCQIEHLLDLDVSIEFFQLTFLNVHVRGKYFPCSKGISILVFLLCNIDLDFHLMLFLVYELYLPNHTVESSIQANYLLMGFKPVRIRIYGGVHILEMTVISLLHDHC